MQEGGRPPRFQEPDERSDESQIEECLGALGGQQSRRPGDSEMTDDVAESESHDGCSTLAAVGRKSSKRQLGQGGRESRQDSAQENDS